VTNWNPLTVWAYEESYIRFAAKDYNPKSTDKYAHLTNNAVVKQFHKKEYGDESGSDEEEEMELDNIWSSEDFNGHITDKFKRNYPDSNDIYRDVIWPQIKKQIKASTQSVQDKVENRPNSFEFYGYDFMVDDQLKVWLIEVNSSPSMESKGQPVLKSLVKSVLTDLAAVVVDYPNSRKADTGGFTLVHKAKNEVNRPKGSM